MVNICITAIIIIIIATNITITTIIIIINVIIISTIKIFMIINAIMIITTPVVIASAASFPYIIFTMLSMRAYYCNYLTQRHHHRSPSPSKLPVAYVGTPVAHGLGLPEAATYVAPPVRLDFQNMVVFRDMWYQE